MGWYGLDGMVWSMGERVKVGWGGSHCQTLDADFIQPRKTALFSCDDTLTAEAADFVNYR